LLNLANFHPRDADDVAIPQPGDVREFGNVVLALLEPELREDGHQYECTEQANGQEDAQAPGGASQILHVFSSVARSSVVMVASARSPRAGPARGWVVPAVPPATAARRRARRGARHTAGLRDTGPVRLLVPECTGGSSAPQERPGLRGTSRHSTDARCPGWVEYRGRSPTRCW